MLDAAHFGTGLRPNETRIHCAPAGKPSSCRFVHRSDTVVTDDADFLSGRAGFSPVRAASGSSCGLKATLHTGPVLAPTIKRMEHVSNASRFHVLVVEPDAGRGANLKQLVECRLPVDAIVARSSVDAILALSMRVPHLLLVSALLSP